MSGRRQNHALAVRAAIAARRADACSCLTTAAAIRLNADRGPGEKLSRDRRSHAAAI